MDFDDIGQLNLSNFVKKVGESKSYPVKELNSEEISKLT